jgi:hypothetical protein
LETTLFLKAHILTGAAFDSRQLALDTSESGKCRYLTHPRSLWQPVSVLELLKNQQYNSTFATNTTMVNPLSILDFSRSLYEQLDSLPSSVVFNPLEVQLWQIHSSFISPSDCLTFVLSNKTISWQDCNVHAKPFLRHHPSQAFHLVVYPPSSLISEFVSHPMVKASDQTIPHQKLISMTNAAAMRVVMVHRDEEHLHILSGALRCLTLSKVIAEGHQEMDDVTLNFQRCFQDSNDPKQLFLPVHSVTIGAHPLSLLGQLRPSIYPNYCVQRKEFKLGLIRCDNNATFTPTTNNLLEFVLIQP